MPLKMARKDKDTFSGGEKNGTRVWELWLVDARRGTWGHQVWDAETCGTGTRDVKYRDAGDAGCEWLLRFQSLSSWICFGEGSPPYPSYGSSMPVYEAKTRRRPPSLKKVKPLSWSLWSSCWWNIGALSSVGWVAVAIRIKKRKLRTPKCWLRNPSPIPLHHGGCSSTIIIVTIFSLFYIFLVANLIT